MDEEDKTVRWLENLQSIVNKGDAGKCPMCGSQNTGYSARVVEDNTNMGYCVVWCNDCKSAFHASRMKVLPGMEANLIPDGLKY